MKKNIIIVFIILLLIIVAISIFLFINRQITIEESYIKEIFSSKNVEDVDIIFIDILGNEKESINNIDVKNSFLSIIKDEKIKPSTVDEDKLLTGDSHKMLIKYNGEEYRLVISNGTITIGNKIYETENNIYEKLSNIFHKK